MKGSAKAKPKVKFTQYLLCRGAGGRPAKADVAMETRATGFNSSDVPVSEPRSEVKVIAVKPLHGGKPREKLSLTESIEPQALEDVSG